MKKIPTVFIRDENDRRHVIPDITPGCEWVFEEPNAVPTRKYDGICVMFDGQHWWARREVKPGKTSPANFVLVQHDETTSKSVGWEPAEQSAFWKYLEPVTQDGLDIGTYEFCGPKVNGNPQEYVNHELIRHSEAAYLSIPDTTFEGLRAWLLEHPLLEGIVWHRRPGDPDTDMAKLKRRDFA